MKLISVISPSVSLSELSLICQAQDIILLRQDAVYLCLRSDLNWPAQLYALDVDIQVRQITPVTNVTVINARRWVELSISAEQNLLWQN
jgi:sulfur relay protein TusB/DsrH